MVKNDDAKVDRLASQVNTVLHELLVCIDEMKAGNVKAVDAILCSIHAYAGCCRLYVDIVLYL